jgi:hypothetical protein
MTNTEIITAVHNVNVLVYRACLETYELEFTTNGVSSEISFLGKRIWFEDEDERRCDPETDKFEPMETFLKRRIVEELTILSGLRELLSLSE